MPSHKVQRNAEDIRRLLADLMRTLKDPRIAGMLSIVKLDLSNDYSHCKVYISSMDGLDAAKTAVEGLSSAAGYIRREIGASLHLRRTPEFKFIADDGIAYSADLNKRLRELVSDPENTASAGEDYADTD